MFTNFSLCPGGAFMMHESAAEYDENLTIVANPAPQQEEVLVQVTEEPAPGVPQIQKSFPEILSGYCPIAAIMNKLASLYDSVQEIGRLDYDPEDVETAMENLERVSQTATDIAETTRLCLVKQLALYNYVGGGYWDSEWSAEPIANNAKFFLLHNRELIEQGYDKVTYQTETIPDIGNWNIGNSIGVFFGLQKGLPDLPVNLFRYPFMTDATHFSSSEDFFNCFFHDPDRLARVSNTNSRTYMIQDLISSLAERRNYRGEPVCASYDTDRLAPQVIQWVSLNLRMIKETCYDLQCKLLEHAGPKYEPETLRKIYAGTMNLFYVPSIVLIMQAYDIKNKFKMREAVTSYVDKVLSVLGPKG